MSYPTTPTGKRLVAALGGIVRYPPYTRPDILAIEQEAVCEWRKSEEYLQALDDAMAAGAQQEREVLGKESHE